MIEGNKNEQNNKKKKKIIIFILIISLLLIIMGVTYAAFQYNFLGNKNVISTGTVSIEFLENTDVISLSNALPISDKEGKEQTDTFDFSVTTKANGDVSLTYGLMIDKLSVDTGYTSLNDNQIKVYLTDYNNNELVAPTLISNLNDSLYSKTNTHNKTTTEIKDKYKLRVWIDSDVLVTGWDTTHYQYKFKISVKTVEPKFPLATEVLINKVDQSGLTLMNHPIINSSETRSNDVITEYRFRGGNDVVTNNYVYFNCNNIKNQTADTCDLYRIIGVFPVDDGTGNIENRVKLIKADIYDNAVWATNNSNNWVTAALNTDLNTNFYRSINDSYKSFIGNAKYHLGGYKNSNVKVDLMYEYERKEEGADYFYSGNPNSWTGVVALMYASDYGYGANSACSDTITLYSYEKTICKNNNWLFLTGDEWLLSQISGNAYSSFSIGWSGYIEPYGGVGLYLDVRPVFYLTSDTCFNNIGDGSFDNPYQLIN